MTGIADEVRQSAPMPLDEELYANLLRTTSILVQRESDALAPLDLTPTQHNVLRILRGAGDGGLRAGEIVERLVAREPDGTRLVDRLVEKGLAERRSDPRDRRVVRVVLSPRGRRRLSEADPAVASAIAPLRTISRARARALVDGLEEVRQAVSGHARGRAVGAGGGR